MNNSIITKILLILTVTGVLVGTTAVYAANANANIGISSSLGVHSGIIVNGTANTYNKDYRIDRYYDHVAMYQQNTNALAVHGINTGSLTSILVNAYTDVLNPLQSALNNATNSMQVNTAYQNYCLYNGCAGFNYHLAARYAIQSLTLRLNYLSSTSNNINQTILANAYGNLTTASTTLYGVVGTSKYENGTANTVWGNIDNARLDFRTLVSEAHHNK